MKILLSLEIENGLGPALLAVVYPSVGQVMPEMTLPEAYSIPLPPVDMYAAGDAGTAEAKLDLVAPLITIPLNAKSTSLENTPPLQYPPTSLHTLHSHIEFRMNLLGTFSDNGSHVHSSVERGQWSPVQTGHHCPSVFGKTPYFEKARGWVYLRCCAAYNACTATCGCLQFFPPQA